MARTGAKAQDARGPDARVTVAHPTYLTALRARRTADPAVAVASTGRELALASHPRDELERRCRPQPTAARTSRRDGRAERRQ